MRFGGGFQMTIRNNSFSLVSQQITCKAVPSSSVSPWLADSGNSEGTAQLTLSRTAITVETTQLSHMPNPVKTACVDV